MGAYVSTEQCSTHYDITLNCSFTYDNVTNEYTRISDYTPGTFSANSDISGVGILGVFIAVTAFALLTSIISVLWQAFKSLGWKKVYPPEDKQKRLRVSVSDILEALVLSCSDQQVFTGAAYALTLRYWNGCKISVYHYNIVANMLLLTCATHLMAVTIVRNYWQYPWLGLLRAMCISGVFVFTGLLFVNQNAEKSLDFPTEVPPVNERSKVANKLSPLLRPFKRATKLMSGLFMLYLLGGIGISAASTVEAGSYIFALRSWVYKSGWIEFENNMNPEQDATDFGQLVPIFMSALILFSFLQIVSDKVTEHNEHKHENDPEKPHQGEHFPFIDPSKTTLVILNNIDTAYQGPQVATPGTYDIESVLSTWNLNKRTSRDPNVRLSTVDMASPGPSVVASPPDPDVSPPGLGIANHSPLLGGGRGSQESVSRPNASASAHGSSASSPTPGSRRTSSHAAYPRTPPPLSSSPSPGSPPTSSRSFSTPRPPLRPGYSPLQQQPGTEPL